MTEEQEKQAQSDRRKAWTWVIVGACALTVAAAFGLSAVTAVRQSQADTAREADKKAQSIAQVAQCFARVKNAPQVLRILGVVDILASNSIKANEAAIAAQPDSPLTKTRRDSLKRLEPARNDLRAFIRRTAEEAPTNQSCMGLADDLGVDPSQLNQ